MYICSKYVYQSVAHSLHSDTISTPLPHLLPHRYTYLLPERRPQGSGTRPCRACQQKKTTKNILLDKILHIYYLKGAHRVLARAHVAQSDDARADGEADVGAKGPCQRKKKTKNILLGKILIVFSLLFLKSRARTASFFLSFFLIFFVLIFFFEVARQNGETDAAQGLNIILLYININIIIIYIMKYNNI